jgi:DUF4097 and DUF4098 domain-containing protein YvlB
MKPFAVLIAAAFALLVLRGQVHAWPSIKAVDTKTYELPSNGVVAVDDSSGDVKVIGWDQDRVEVTTTRSAWSDDDLHRLSTKVEPRGDSFSIAAVYPSHCMNCDVSFEIRVPSRANVTIATSSGDVRISSIAGPAHVDSSSGDVTLKNIGGEIHVHSSSGDVTLDGAQSSVDAVTSSGDIEARHLSADVNLVASSGSLDAEFATFDAVHLIRMECSSGDISLTVPRGVGFKVEATTSSGSIDSNLHLPIRERDSGADVSAQVGDGKASVQLRATSGDIGITMR